MSTTVSFTPAVQPLAPLARPLAASPRTAPAFAIASPTGPARWLLGLGGVAMWVRGVLRQEAKTQELANVEWVVESSAEATDDACVVIGEEPKNKRWWFLCRCAGL